MDAERFCGALAPKMASAAELRSWYYLKLVTYVFLYVVWRFVYMCELSTCLTEGFWWSRQKYLHFLSDCAGYLPCILSRCLQSSSSYLLYIVSPVILPVWPFILCLWLPRCPNCMSQRPKLSDWMLGDLSSLGEVVVGTARSLTSRSIIYMLWNFHIFRKCIWPPLFFGKILGIFRKIIWFFT